MHLVIGNILTLYRTERASSDVQRYFFALQPSSIDVAQHGWCEMKACRRGCHTSLDARINGLISCIVCLLSLSVQVRRDGKFAGSIDDVGERTAHTLAVGSR